MKFDIDSRALEKALLRMELVADTLPSIAAQVRAETEVFSYVAAMRNIYSTQAGAYQRTQALLNGLKTQARILKNSASITVSGSMPYMRQVELGTGATQLTPAQSQAYARANPAAALYLGRSGVNYSLPGPIIASSQAFAFFRLQQLFAVEARRV